MLVTLAMPPGDVYFVTEVISDIVNDYNGGIGRYLTDARNSSHTLLGDDIIELNKLESVYLQLLALVPPGEYEWLSIALVGYGDNHVDIDLEVKSYD